MALELSRHDDASHITLTPRGEIDVATAESLTNQIAAALDDNPQAVTIELAAITLLDSVGISALLKSRRLADMHGTQLRVVGARGVVREVLEITGVYAHLAGPAR